MGINYIHSLFHGSRGAVDIQEVLIMSILNYRSYGEDVLGLRWPFGEDEVKEEMQLVARIKAEKKARLKYHPEPKSIELTGSQFIAYCQAYNQNK